MIKSHGRDSGRDFGITPCPVSNVRQYFTSNDISSKTAGLFSTKLYRSVPDISLFKNCSKDSAPCQVLVTGANIILNIKNLLIEGLCAMRYAMCFLRTAKSNIPTPNI